MKYVMKKLLERYHSLSAPVRASFWALFCSVFQSGISLITTPIFTRVLSQEEYGIYSQYSSWLGILSILVTLNLSGETYMKGLSDHEEEEASFTASMLGLDIAIFTGFLILFLLAPSFWASLFNLTPLLTGMMFVHLFVSNPFDFWKSRERYHYRYRLSSLLSIGVTVFSYAFSIYAVLNSSNRLNARIEADLLVRVLFGLPLLAVLLKHSQKLYDKATWKYALQFALPLIPHYLSNMILNQSDRIMIGKLVGNAEAGRYSIAYMIASMVLMIVTAVNSSFVPFTFQNLKRNNGKAVRSGANLLLLGIALLCVIAMGMAPEVIRVVAGSSYAEAADIVPTVSSSVFFIFIYTLFSNVEYHFNKTQYVGTATLLAAGLNVVLNWLLIPRFGYTVAGTTTLISYMFLSLFHYVCYRLILNQESYEPVYDIRMILLISGILTLLTFFIHTIFHIIWLRYLIVFASLLISVFAMKRAFVK